MYNFSIFSNNLNVSTLYHSTNDSAFLIVIEALDWHLAQIKDERALHKILNEAFRLMDININISEIPSEFARNIDFVLRESNNLTTDYKGLSFTGISLTKDKVFVCTAGYTRVHLLQGEKVIDVTRDHNLVSDIDENTSDEKLDVKFETCPPLFFAQTRALGLEQPNKPAELITWDVTGNYSILVCSNKFHKFRKPDEYIKSFVDNSNFKTVDENKQIYGIVATIEYVKNSIIY
jgi:serine/threonine protein phosphatase PrpC